MVLHKAHCRFLLWYELSDRWDHVTVDSGFLDNGLKELKTLLDGCRQTSVNISETRMSLDSLNCRLNTGGLITKPECGGCKDNYDDACILSQSKSSQK